jgi:hypothetical protein
MSKILHTITCSSFVPAYNANEQFTRHLIRRRPLTLQGIERMFRRGCFEYAAREGVRVTRVETMIYAR